MLFFIVCMLFFIVCLLFFVVCCLRVFVGILLDAFSPKMLMLFVLPFFCSMLFFLSLFSCCSLHTFIGDIFYLFVICSCYLFFVVILLLLFVVTLLLLFIDACLLNVG